MNHRPTTHFRVITSLFLSALYFVFAVGIWGVQNEKFGINADVNLTPGTITVSGTDDLTKAAQAGDGNVIVKDNNLALKETNNTGDWIQKADVPAKTSDAGTLVASGFSAVATPPALSYDSVNHRSILQFGTSTYAYDRNQNTWTPIAPCTAPTPTSAPTAAPVQGAQSNVGFGSTFVFGGIVIPPTTASPTPSPSPSVAATATIVSACATPPVSVVHYWSNSLKKLIANNCTLVHSIGIIDPAKPNDCEQLGSSGFETPPTIYDSVHDRVITIPTSPSHFLTVFDVAAKKNTVFTDTSSTSTPPSVQVSNWPPDRAGAALAFNTDTGELYLFGGTQSTSIPGTSSLRNFCSNIINIFGVPAGCGVVQEQLTPGTIQQTTLSDVWSLNFDTKTWTQHAISSPISGRASSQIIYDPTRKQFVLFGGLLSSNLQMGTPLTVDLGICTDSLGRPAVGCTPASSTSPVTASSVTFTAGNQTLTFDPASDTFTVLKTTHTPTGRFNGGMVFDTDKKEVLMTNGIVNQTSTNLGPVMSPDKISKEAWVLSNGKFPSSGTCQSDVGSTAVGQFTRVTAIKNADHPADTSVSLAFAGSTDGVNFSQFSAPVKLSAAKATADVVDVTKLIPNGSHFMRIKCTLATTDLSATPTLGGFKIDFGTITTETTPGSPTPVPTITKNGTPVAVTPVTTTPPKATVAASKNVGSLVATGGSLPFNLGIAALLSLLTTYLFLRKHSEA